MEQELLQFIGIFIGGLVCGVLIMLVFNKLSSGTASPKGLKQEYDDYQVKVESHFEETSKKFQEMTEQYQGLYKHLSVGATTLCRPESVAATLADQSASTVKIEAQQEPVAEASPKVDGAVPPKADVNQENVEPEKTSSDVTNAEKAKTQAEPSKPVPQAPLKTGPVTKNAASKDAPSNSSKVDEGDSKPKSS